MTKEKLEKEAEEWLKKNSKGFITNPNYSPFDYAEAIYFAGAEPREKRIAELEKENAELKAKNKWYSEQVCNKECAEVWGNLTKATDLLKWFVWYFREGSPNLVPYKHKVAEAEQFLNSEVEK